MSDGGYEGAWPRRLQLLQLLLIRHRVSTARVASALGITRRTALGDLKALDQAGVPLFHEGEGREREWVLGEAWRQLGFEIGLKERLSLMFGRELISGFLRDTDIGQAFTRIDRQVGAMDRGRLSERNLARRFIYVREPEKDYRDHRETIHHLVEAIVHSYRVAFTYHQARPPQKVQELTVVSPLTLAIYRRGLYLLAEHRSEQRIFALERIRDLQVDPRLTFDYPRPSEYDPRHLLDRRFGLASDGSLPERVRLRFTAAGRPYAEARLWMPDQVVEPREDGGCDIIFEASGLELVKPILGYGALVEVIEPRSLRDRVRTMLRDAAAIYADDD